MSFCHDCEDAPATAMYAQGREVARMTGQPDLHLCVPCYQRRMHNPHWICRACGDLDRECPRGNRYCRPCVRKMSDEQDHLDEMRSLRHLSDEERERI